MGKPCETVFGFVISEGFLMPISKEVIMTNSTGKDKLSITQLLNLSIFKT